MKLRSLLQAGLFVLLGLLTSASFAQQDISGTWQGKLQIAPGNEIGIQFILKKQADGTYAATVNSPDNESIKNVSASKVQFAANKLSLTVDSLSGSYEGTWDKNAITGKWKQPGSDLPLNLKQYVKTELSQADMKKLLGSWVGKAKTPGGQELNIVFKFEVGADKKIKGNGYNPDQTPEPKPLSDIEFIEGQLEFKVPSVRAKYSGQLKGDKLEGTLEQGSQKVPLNLAKGEYVPAPAVVKLADDTKKQLIGEWVGAIKIPQGSLAIVLRFKKAGETLSGEAAFPERSPAGLSIKEMVQTDKTLLFKIPGINVEFTAELKKEGEIDVIAGFWKQGANNAPLTLKKGKYVAPPPPTLALSADAIRALKGTWRGKLDPLNLVVRIETNAKGEAFGYLNSPDQGAKGIPITEATLAGNKLTLRIARIGAEYVADLSGNKLTGQWTQRDSPKPLSMTR